MGRQKFSRHFHPSARKALHDRLAREDPDYTPPPPQTRRELLVERLGMFALFLVMAAAVLGIAMLD